MLSLKAFFSSNLSFFNMYRYLFGFSGTQGGSLEKSFMRSQYGADFFRLPRFAQRRYEELPAVVIGGPASCNSNADPEVDATMNNDSHVSFPDLRRAGLIICETIRDANLLYRVAQVHPELQKVLRPEVFLYDRSYLGAVEIRTLKPGSILIGTNIIGRGSDFAASDLLVLNRGIHVILSYMPKNERVSTQAFGRTARSDKPGTGR
ncbi:unnamed protein product, partial [Amoebophrya sp. A25]|eukprot:GSA25T00015335001.1